VITTRPKHSDGIVAVRAVNEKAFDGIVGHVFFSPDTIRGEMGTIQGMGFSPTVVLPERHREGIGSQLVEAGLQVLRQQGCPCVIVVGHPE